MSLPHQPLCMPRASVVLPSSLVRSSSLLTMASTPRIPTPLHALSASKHPADRVADSSSASSTSR